MLSRSYLLIYLATVACQAWAACPRPEFTPSSDVRLDGAAALLVTHASREFDPKERSKAGIDRGVAAAKARGVPVVYLHEPEEEKHARYFYGDCTPTHYVASYGGEFAFTFRTPHIWSAGGWFEACKERTVRRVLQVFASEHRTDDIRLTELLDASYQIQGHLRGNEPYYPAFRAFQQSTGSASVTLFDLMGIIRDARLELEYLTRYVRALSYDFPPYHRVVLARDGKLVSTFHAGGAGAPTLTIDFVTSLTPR